MARNDDMRVAALAVYYLIARWLPPSDVVGGRIWRRCRGALARRCFEHTGRDVNVQKGVYFGRGDRIRLGNRSSLGVNAEVHGPVHIGNDVMMGPYVIIYTENHRFEDVTVAMIDQGYDEPSPVTIEDDVWIGARTIILPGVTIGSGSVIGAGSVVTRSIPPKSVAAGNPCRVIRTRGSRAG
jgi:maltose O-acetyltransferase